MSKRETSDVAAGARRMIRALGRRLADEDPGQLVELIMLQGEVDNAWRLAVAGQRDRGATDADIGRALGVTRQAVRKRWPAAGPRPVGAGARWR